MKAIIKFDDYTSFYAAVAAKQYCNGLTDSLYANLAMDLSEYVSKETMSEITTYADVKKKIKGLPLIVFKELLNLAPNAVSNITDMIEPPKGDLDAGVNANLSVNALEHLFGAKQIDIRNYKHLYLMYFNMMMFNAGFYNMGQFLTQCPFNPFMWQSIDTSIELNTVNDYDKLRKALDLSALFNSYNTKNSAILAKYGIEPQNLLLLNRNTRGMRSKTVTSINNSFVAIMRQFFNYHAKNYVDSVSMVKEVFKMIYSLYLNMDEIIVGDSKLDDWVNLAKQYQGKVDYQWIFDMTFKDDNLEVVTFKDADVKDGILFGGNTFVKFDYELLISALKRDKDAVTKAKELIDFMISVKNNSYNGLSYLDGKEYIKITTPVKCERTYITDNTTITYESKVALSLDKTYANVRKSCNNYTPMNGIFTIQPGFLSQSNIIKSIEFDIVKTLKDLERDVFNKTNMLLNELDLNAANKNIGLEEMMCIFDLQYEKSLNNICLIKNLNHQSPRIKREGWHTLQHQDGTYYLAKPIIDNSTGRVIDLNNITLYKSDLSSDASELEFEVIDDKYDEYVLPSELYHNIPAEWVVKENPLFAKELLFYFSNKKGQGLRKLSAMTNVPYEEIKAAYETLLTNDRLEKEFIDKLKLSTVDILKDLGYININSANIKQIFSTYGDMYEEFIHKNVARMLIIGEKVKNYSGIPDEAYDELNDCIYRKNDNDDSYTLYIYGQEIVMTSLCMQEFTRKLSQFTDEYYTESLRHLVAFFNLNVADIYNAQINLTINTEPVTFLDQFIAELKEDTVEVDFHPNNTTVISTNDQEYDILRKEIKHLFNAIDTVMKVINNVTNVEFRHNYQSRHIIKLDFKRFR